MRIMVGRDAVETTGCRSGPALPTVGASFAAAMDASAAVSQIPQPSAPPVVAPAACLSPETIADRRDHRDRHARKRSTEILALLTRLQRSTLWDGDRGDALDRLSEALVAMPVAADPALAALGREVEVRARVELARAGR